MTGEALLRPERGFPASVAVELVVAAWLGLMTRSVWVADRLEIEPWSEAVTCPL